MVRFYKRKTDIPCQEALQRAGDAVKTGISVRAAAKAAGVDRMALSRFITNKGKDGKTKLSEMKLVFTSEQESALAAHIRQLDDRFYGLSTDKVRELASRYAAANKVAVPSNWEKDGLAGQHF